MSPVHTEAVTIQLFDQEPRAFAGDLLAYLVEEDIFHLGDAGKALNRVLQQVCDTGDFKGGKEQTFLLYPSLAAQEEGNAVCAKRVLFAGLGKQDDAIHVRRERLRLVGGVVAQQAAAIKAKDVLVVLPKDYLLDAVEIAECLAEGLLLGNYRFDLYKSPPKDEKDQPARVERFYLHDGGLSQSAVRKGLERGRAIGEATNAARDMANHPANYWTPAEFAEYAKKLSKRTSLKCKALDKGAMQKLGMGGILGVNQGSAVPPQLVILEYRTNRKNPTLLLVGKGLTFDSGGVSLKPPAGMEDMKYDMCGGAAVLAAMQAIAEIGVAGVNVVGLIPATENMAGAAALKPGDVIRHYGGKTSEIINTDAEGRLILADALAYGIATYQPEAVIDMATLTGAVIIGLGHHYTGLLTNNDQLAAQLLEAGAQVGEPQWRLPLGPEYRKQIDSRVADIKNAGSDRSAGTITAACYLQEFVGETPWAHLDIAGTAWNFTEKSYIPKGPSGVGVRTLVACLSQWKGLKSVEKK
ncbi:leucyl aminopeptidase [Desulfobulbus sp.]|uniref:leucyl aminopeptidase n=1 Tax=Desulfobulbus sp. TaxID=895 RepID=UPI0027B9DDE0|nr:leucyl aminopeptidase [Desulfobulbus sp.]